MVDERFPVGAVPAVDVSPKERNAVSITRTPVAFRISTFRQDRFDLWAA